MSDGPYYGITSHPICNPTNGHQCHRPSGRPCVDCGRPAGTLWTPVWCPDCDARRLDNVSAGFAELAEALGVPSEAVDAGSGAANHWTALTPEHGRERRS